VPILTGSWMTQLSWVGWVGLAGVLTISGLFVLARDRARRKTLVEVVRAAEGPTMVVDRARYGRMLMVVKLADGPQRDHCSLRPTARDDPV
jgi:hypothetical protein